MRSVRRKKIVFLFRHYIKDQTRALRRTILGKKECRRGREGNIMMCTVLYLQMR